MDLPPSKSKGKRRRRFCSTDCVTKAKQAGLLAGGRFQEGHATWNKDMKGIHLSPASEFKPGRDNHRANVGDTSIRTDKHDKKRAWVKTAEPNVWRMRAVLVWESANGPLPVGKVVHHKDRDSLNDAPDNLQDLTRAEHLAEHRGEFAPRTWNPSARQREIIRERGINKIGALTRDDVRAIKDRIAKVDLLRVIAKDYPVSSSTIQHIKCGSYRPVWLTRN